VKTPIRNLPCLPARATLIHKYKICFRHFERFLGRVPLITDLDEDVISQHLCEFAEGRSPATVEKQRSQLMAMATLGHKKGFLAEAPEVPAIRQPRRSPDALTSENMRRLAVAVRDVPGEISGIPAAMYWQAWLLIAYNTGERTGALFGIRLIDLRLDVPAIRFRWERNKARKESVKRIREETRAAIVRMMEPQRTSSTI